MAAFRYYSGVMNPCPLCAHPETEDYFQDRNRRYFCCPLCRVVFVLPEEQLSEEEEKAVYDLHENDPSDAGYRRFLSRLADPLLMRLEGKQKGLDFGCGPGPALAKILEEKGHRVALFDPFYHNDATILEQSYDFICSTEVWEHLRDPAADIDRLFGILKPGGCLAIMTKRVQSREAFTTWHYIQDPTHILFFSLETFRYLAKKYSCVLEIIDRDIVFFYCQET